VKGFYTEEGLSVQAMPYLDSRTAFEQVKPHRLWVQTDRGITEADFGFFDMDQFHHMAAGKVDYYIVEGMHFGCQVAMVPADSPMTSPADLKGKKVAIPPGWVEPFLLHGHMWVNEWLKAPGYDSARDVTLAPIPWDSLPHLADYVAEGFKTDKFAAVLLLDPLSGMLEEKKIARPLVTQNQTTYNKEYCCFFTVRKAIVDNQPDKAALIVRAFRRAKQWVAQNPREAVLASKTVGYLAATSVERSAKEVSNLGFDGQLDVAQALERSIKQRIDSGAIKTDKTPQELVRLHYRRME
jgi:NitT/TauT family transport system substrate-binding protein